MCIFRWKKKFDPTYHSIIVVWIGGEETKDEANSVINTCGWFLLAWVLHYFPFFAMKRILYYHHYFPAFMISAMLSGILLEHLLSIGSSFVSNKWKTTVYNTGVGAFLLLTFCSFYVFRGLTYGINRSADGKANGTAINQWVDSWISWL